MSPLLQDTLGATRHLTVSCADSGGEAYDEMWRLGWHPVRFWAGNYGYGRSFTGAENPFIRPYYYVGGCGRPYECTRYYGQQPAAVCALRVLAPQSTNTQSLVWGADYTARSFIKGQNPFIRRISAGILP